MRAEVPLLLSLVTNKVETGAYLMCIAVSTFSKLLSGGCLLLVFAQISLCAIWYKSLLQIPLRGKGVVLATRDFI